MRYSKNMLIAASVAVGVGVAAPSAKAAFTLDLQQVGPDVIETGLGTIDTAGLTDASLLPVTSPPFLLPSLAFDLGGGLTSNGESFTGITGPRTFGGGGKTNASSGSGDTVGINGSDGLLILPTGYVSGALLSDTDTFSGQTLATLGFTPGTYTYTFGTGADADSFVVASVVPEPACLGLVSLGGLILLRRRRRQAADRPRA